MTKKAIYQIGTIGSLLQTVYETDYSFAELAKQGDFGLGTLNGVDGEMICFDGGIYQIDDKGVVHSVDSNQCTPFSVVADFQPSMQIDLQDIESYEAFEKVVDKQLPSLNYIYMMRLDGFFPYVKMRSLACQQKPYRPLVETLDTHQKIFEAENVEGTMVITRFPSYLAAVNVAGYHIHFLEKNKQSGGHVFNLKIREATLDVARYLSLKMDAIDNASFAEADLASDYSDSTKTVEKQR